MASKAITDTDIEPHPPTLAIIPTMPHPLRRAAIYIPILPESIKCISPNEYCRSGRINPSEQKCMRCAALLICTPHIKVYVCLVYTLAVAVVWFSCALNIFRIIQMPRKKLTCISIARGLWSNFERLQLRSGHRGRFK